jgi:hypothetical protein
MITVPDSSRGMSSSYSRDLRRALLVAAAVGSALVVLNQGDLLAAALGGASLPWTLSWKVPLTYLVPFLVSLGSSRATRRSLSRPGRTSAEPDSAQRSGISCRSV